MKKKETVKKEVPPYTVAFDAGKLEPIPFYDAKTLNEFVSKEKRQFTILNSHGERIFRKIFKG